MTHSSSLQLQSPLDDICDVVQFQTLFHLQQAYIKRTKTPFSLVFIGLHPEANEIHYGILSEFLHSQLRSSDFIFESKSQHFTLVLLSFSGEYEASYFLKRLEKGITTYFKNRCDQDDISLRTVTMEINNNLSTLEDILQTGITALETLVTTSDDQVTSFIPNFREREIEKIKVSIIENDPMILSILQNLMERTVVKYFSFDIQTFSDGLEFLESNWYQSGHTHIVLLNDILPRVNGMEILKTLRGLPNTQKYIIFMMSKRQDDESISYNYENGVDAYFTRPFNLRLMEAQMKSILKRLRL